MRVLHIIASVSAKRGGPSQAALQLCGSQRKSGIDAIIATTNDDGASKLQVQLGNETEYSGAKCIFFDRLATRIRAVHEFGVSTELKRWLRSNASQYDIAHVHGIFSYAPSVGMKVLRQRNVPYFVRPSGLLGEWALKQSPLRKKAFLLAADRANLNGSAAIEYKSDLEKEEAQHLQLKAPTVVIPYGLPIPTIIPDATTRLKQKFKLPRKQRILLFMSRLHHKKGVDRLISAFHDASPPNVTLLIAGGTGDMYDHYLQDLAKRGAASASIIFCGFVSGEMKQVCLQGSDAFVLPSASESFGIAVAEAIAAGTPVIISPQVPLSKFVEKHNLGWIAPPSVASVTHAILKAFSNDSLETFTNTREHGRDYVNEHFGWNAISDQISHMYHQHTKQKT
ncbi:glycosyl transferase, group 1 family protein [Rhodopirellula sp. SWK7]|nr:glycosyl transferase, group 1 family protein [Rhodopirellula sp. SWK7]